MSLATAIKSSLGSLRLPTGGAPSPPAARIVGFHVPHQEQDNWCWSAVAAGVAALYGAVWQQCNIAGLELGQQCCPAGSNANACNVPYRLDMALRRVGHFQSMITGTASFAPQVATEIAANRPIGVRIGWPNDGGHFVAIAGYSTAGGQFVDVEDPWYSASTVAYSVLVGAYQGSGTWTHTYWTN